MHATFTPLVFSQLAVHGFDGRIAVASELTLDEYLSPLLTTKPYAT